MGVLQVFERFFEDLSGDAAPPAPGHLYWVPVPETQEVPRVLDVQRATPDEHWATVFEITEIGNHHFKTRNRLPIKKLDLGETEELLIAKAKKCPQPYAAIGGIAYFLADTAHPDRFLFFSIGQYAIPVGKDRTWQSSIVFLD